MFTSDECSQTVICTTDSVSLSVFIHQPEDELLKTGSALATFIFCETGPMLTSVRSATNVRSNETKQLYLYPA